MNETIGDRLRSVPKWVWAGMAIMLLAGGYEIYAQGIVYGSLFFVGGILTLWADFRDRNPSEQEALATEEGLTTLNWTRWIALFIVALTVIYGLYVAQAPSSVFLALVAIESVIRYSDQLLPDRASSIAPEDTATESFAQSRESIPSSIDSATRPTEPVLNDEQTVGVAILVGALVYIIGWVAVIPGLFPSAERPSNSALTLVTGIVAFVAYGVTVRFIDGWVNVVVDQDRLENAEERRIFRFIDRYWFQMLVVLILLLFVVSTEVLGLW